jgi:hypothetical protein
MFLRLEQTKILSDSHKALTICEIIASFEYINNTFLSFVEENYENVYIKINDLESNQSVSYGSLEKEEYVVICLYSTINKNISEVCVYVY